MAEVGRKIYGQAAVELGYRVMFDGMIGNSERMEKFFTRRFKDWDYYDFPEYTVAVNNGVVSEKFKGDRIICGKQGPYHFMFRKRDGFTAKWGRTKEDDPPYCPWGNEIADIEVTTACSGIRDKKGERKPCAFCFPAGTMVTKSDGSHVPIESILPNDEVQSCQFESGGKNYLRRNIVQEVYERDYSGELIVIELENGVILRMTPEHPVLLSDGTEIMAKDLTGNEDIVIENDFTHCRECGKPKYEREFYDRYFCSKECYEKSRGTCLLCGQKIDRKGSLFCKQCVIVPEGMSTHPLMNTWKTMLFRCYNPSRNKHEFYADQHITVCERWHNFQNFVDDMGMKPYNSYTLDRIDNSKEYCPENCRWASQREQKLNRGRFRTSKRKYKGVHFQSGSYHAVIRIDSKSYYLGSFSTEEEAAIAYDKKLLENGGDYAHCNILKGEEQ